MLEISRVDVYGLERAIITSRYPKVVNVDEYYKTVDIKGLQLWLDNGLKEIDAILKSNRNIYKLEDDIVHMKVQGKEIMFSPQDLPKIHQRKWHYNSTRGYVRDSKGEFELHRFISNNPENYDVDHINGNKNDYTRNNLRLCTHRENSINRGLQKNNTSGVVGVYWDKRRCTWYSRIVNKNKTYNLGSFKNKEDAIISRLSAEKECFGEFAPQRHLFYQYGIEDSKETHLPKYPDITEYLRAYRCIKKLSDTGGGEGHEQALTGITVTFDLTASIQFWPEAQRYKFLNFISSTSKMHKLSKMSISKSCNEHVDKDLIEIAKKYQDKYNEDFKKYQNKEITKEELDDSFYKMVYNIPLGFELTAGMITNYRCLRNIYRQRRNHRLEEWQIFCDWIETLPMADELITVGLKNKE